MEGHAEAVLLSSMVRTGKTLAPAEAGITHDHFAIHKTEYEWIENYSIKHQKAPSPALFSLTFREFRILKTDDLDYAIELVRKEHLRRTLAKSTRDCLSLLKDDEPEKALAALHKSVAGMEKTWDTARGGVDVLNEWSDHFRLTADKVNRMDASGISGVPFGMPTVDERTGGMQPGELWLFGARLTHGKTWNLVAAGVAALMAGKKVLFDSLEQPAPAMTARFHTVLGRQLGWSLSNRAITQGRGLDLKDYREFLEVLPSKVPGSLFICDTHRGRVTPMTIAGQIERHKPDLVIVDYVTLLGASDGGRATDDWRVAASISADLKMVATQYNIPILAAAQINRAGESAKRPPSAKDLAESDNLGRDTDVLLTMRRFSKSSAQYLLAKNRNGEDNVMWYSEFLPDEGFFGECSYERAQQLKNKDAEDAEVE